MSNEKDALRAAPASPEGDGWFPYATAPMDGEWFLACWATPKIPAYGVVKWGGLDWIEASEVVGPFTHWRPLPDPPRAMIAAAPGVVGNEDNSSVAGLPAHVADATATDTHNHSVEED